MDTSLAIDSCQIEQVCGGWACGGILELDECRVDLEGIRDVLRTLRAEVVQAEAAHESRVGESMAADSKIRMGSCVLEGDQ